LPEVVDEQGVKCGVVLTQSSQETQDNTDADESLHGVKASSIECIFNH
jgi:hypothetical protein